MGGHLTPEVLNALLAATADPSRLVRIRTAMSLAALPPQSLTNERDRASLEKANREFITAMQARPDDWASYANLGNFYMERRELLRGRRVLRDGDEVGAAADWPDGQCLDGLQQHGPERQGRAEPASRAEDRAGPTRRPTSTWGCCLAEQGRLPEAEQALRAALKADPQMAAAAYNLGVLLGENEPGRGDCVVPEGSRLAPDRSEVRPHAGLLPSGRKETSTVLSNCCGR